MRKYLALFFLLMSAYLMIGCEADSEPTNPIETDTQTDVIEHTHIFESVLSYDNEYHWFDTKCEHKDVVVKIAHTMTSNINGEIKVHSCSSCDYTYEEEKVDLTINYQYSDGQIIKSISDQLFIGEQYSYLTPTINYMIPDLEVVEGVINADTIINVTYDYSYESIRDLNDIKPIIVRENAGVAISFVASGLLKMDEVLIYGDTFAIHGASVVARNSQDASIYHASWNSNSAVASVDGNKMSVFSQPDDERLITISITPYKNIEIYVDGKLQYCYYANVMSDSFTAKYNSYDYRLIGDLVDNIYSELACNGFKIGSSNAVIHDVIVSSYLDKESAMNLYNQFILIKVDYVNEVNQKIAVSTKLLGRQGDLYSAKTKRIAGFIAEDSSITGQFMVNKNYLIEYTTLGTEHLPSGKNEINKPTAMEWANTNTWYYFARNLDGDYTVVVSYTLLANQFDESGNYASWKTVLPIHFDESNNDRWVCRFDSYGWQDDLDGDRVLLGSNAYYGSMYSENSTKELQELCKSCDVIAIFTRRGNTLNMTSIITPLNSESTDEVYYWNCYLENVTRKKIGLAASCEYASIKVKSIKY